MNRPGLIEIFSAFLRLGLTAFGGPAMVPYIRAATVDRLGWLDDEDFKLGVSVCQLIPGATAMQVAAYAGLRARGGPGALAAYLGFGLPAFCLMLGLSIIYFSSRDIVWVQALFSGLKVIVAALVLNAALDFARRYLDSWASRLLAGAAAIWFALGGNPILALVLCCGLGVIVLGDNGNGGGDGPLEASWSGVRSAVAFLLGLLLFLGLLFFIDPTLFGLATLMAKVDCFAFGGGYVSLPIMLHEVVDVRGWMTEPRFMDGIGLGQITPGPIVMTSAFVGYAVAGVLGAVVASVAVFWPSLIFLTLAAPFARRLSVSPLARKLLAGSLVCLVGLLAGTAVRFGVQIPWDVPRAVLGGAALIALVRGVDVLWVVLAGAGASAVLFTLF